MICKYDNVYSTGFSSVPFSIVVNDFLGQGNGSFLELKICSVGYDARPQLVWQLEI
jgi:hypothetical protein